MAKGFPLGLVFPWLFNFQIFRFNPGFRLFRLCLVVGFDGSGSAKIIAVDSGKINYPAAEQRGIPSATLREKFV